jgi:hypothetical protein
MTETSGRAVLDDGTWNGVAAGKAVTVLVIDRGVGVSGHARRRLRTVG